MRIHLPNSAFLGNIDRFIKSFDPEKKDELILTSNREWVAVHPVVLSMVASVGLDIIRNGGRLAIEPPEARSRHYLDRMGLMKILKMPPIKQTRHEPAGRFIPISIINNSKELSKFIEDMIPLLHKEPQHTAPIKYVISELVRNVFEHSCSVSGAVVCAQYFKKSNRISIGVSDTGIGIRKSISANYSVTNDMDAIKLALTPGITGTTKRIGGTEENAGAGLFFIKSIAKVNRNFFIVYSGSGMYKLLKEKKDKKIRLNSDPSEDKHSESTNFPYWQGTVVGIDMSLERHEPFTEFLDKIREVYRLDIKDRRKRKFKRARFI